MFTGLLLAILISVNCLHAQSGDPSEQAEKSARLERLARQEQTIRDQLEKRRNEFQQHREERRQAGATTQTIPAIDEPKEQSGTLFAGESVTFRGVTMRWVVPENEKTTATLPGFLRFEGPSGTVQTKAANGSAYLDGAWIDYREGKTISSKAFEFTAKFYPSDQVFDGRGIQRDVAVSYLTPIHLNDWRLSVSDKAVAYPDGKEYYELKLEPSGSKEEKSLPLVAGNKRQFGRYQIIVRLYDEHSRTALLGVTTDIDRSVHGRAAYVNEIELEFFDTFHGIFNTGKSLAENLDPLGKQFGFEIEWSSLPQKTQEGIEYVRNLKQVRGISPRGRSFMTVDLEMQEAKHAYNIDYEWIDPTHLKIWATDYQEYLARQNKVKEEKAAKEQKEKEEQVAKELVEKQNQEARTQQEKKLQAAREEFFAKNKPVTEIYKLTGFSPKTAYALILRELTKTFLVATENQYLSVTESELKERGLTDNLHLSLEDEATLDDQAGVAVVTATPATHARIKKALEDAKGILSQTAAQAPAKQFRIDLALLRGLPSSSNMMTQTMQSSPMRQIKINSPAYPGYVVKNEIFLGRKVKTGDLLFQIARDALAPAKVIGDSSFKNEEHIEGYIVRAPMDGEIVQLGDQPGINQQIDESVYLATIAAPFPLKEDVTTTPTRQIKVFTLQTGRVRVNKIYIGKKVQKGDVLLQLDASGLIRDRDDYQKYLSQLREKIHLAESQIQEAEKRVKAGTPDIDLERKKDYLNGLNGELTRDERLIQDREKAINEMTVESPVAGEIIDSANPGINQNINADTWLATIAAPLPAEGIVTTSTQRTKIQTPFGPQAADSRVEKTNNSINLKQLGLGPKDLSEFGVDSYELLGRAVVSLNNLKGEEGTAMTALTNAYRCRLSFVDARPPYVIVRAALLPADEKAAPLLENTLFLETDKPSVLGLTNLKDTLVIVAKMK